MDLFSYGTPTDRRERVLKAVQHQETDYVPYNFHAIPMVYHKIMDYYGLASSEEVADFIGNHVVKIGTDFNYNPWAEEVKDLDLTPSGGPVHTNLDASGALHEDEFGCVWDRTSGMPHPVAYPLSEDWRLFDSYQMPDPFREGRFDKAQALADRWRDRAFLFGKLGMALFERAWSIRGLTELMMDMVERPQFVHDLLDRIVTEWDLPVIDQQIDIGVDGFYFSDDWGTSSNMMFSPGMWRKFIRPRLKTIFDHCHNRGVYVGLHSDGKIQAIFPDLVEIGLDIFNPLEPSVMNPVEMKQRYGDKITFYGGIDVEHTMPFGTPEEVRAEIRERNETMTTGGGYILQTSHQVLWDTPMENIVAYIEEVRSLAGLETPTVNHE
ncbi:MAG: uroporphyrinogen decarboxylase family protein [Chloroflexota bacterium]|nr:uroporphyrinogen decarboxylase family protein [Chloroflexota bacterium]